MENASISISGLVLERGGKPFATLPDFTLMRGQVMALTGASGFGKSTAILAMAGIRAPLSGTVQVSGINPWALSNAKRDRFRGQHIGLVFQTFHLVDAVSVETNLTLAASCAGLKPVHSRIQSLMERLGIFDLRRRLPGALSQGQAQRVAVARALVNGPAVIIADEPTSALDDGNAQAMLALLMETAKEQGAALVLATHDSRVTQAVDHVVKMEAVQ
jgi:putative ABC transport system ATP-binding protein